MAISFKKAKGTAQKSVPTFKYVDGDNVVRMVGDILPRYVYWVRGTNGKDIPIECLAFNRETEKFDNKEVDHVQSYFPDAKCSWNYAVACLDPTDGTVKALNLKKKLFEQVRETAEDMGDPTDLDTGWSLRFKKAKTGSNAWDVSYSLQPLKLKVEALTDEEKALVAESPSIDSWYPRPTAAEVKALLERITKDEGEEEEAESATDKEAVDELNNDVPQ